MTIFWEWYLETMIEHIDKVRMLGLVLAFLDLALAMFLVAVFKVDPVLMAIVGITLWLIVYALSAIILVLMLVLNEKLTGERSD